MELLGQGHTNFLKRTYLEDLFYLTSRLIIKLIMIIWVFAKRYTYISGTEKESPEWTNFH